MFETSPKRLREVAIFSNAHISTQSYKAHKKIKKHSQNEQNISLETNPNETVIRISWQRVQK